MRSNTALRLVEPCEPPVLETRIVAYRGAKIRLTTNYEHVAKVLKARRALGIGEGVRGG